MTKEQKDKILRALTEDRNCYARECERRIAGENGKIIGADYMIQRFLDVLSTEVESESEEISREEIAALLASEGKESCDNCKHNAESWDSDACDGCCGNHSRFEPQEMSREEIAALLARESEERKRKEVLQKIRQKIDGLRYDHWIGNVSNYAVIDTALEIIDAHIEVVAESEEKMSDYILELEEACKLLKDNCVNSKCETCIFNTNLSEPNCRIMDTPEIWPVDKIFDDKGE